MGIEKKKMVKAGKKICFPTRVVILFAVVMILFLWWVIFRTAPTVSSCKSLYTTVNTEGPLWSKEGYDMNNMDNINNMNNMPQSQPLGSATVGGCAATGSKCSECSSMGSYEWSPCKCFGIQGAAINAPRPLKTSSCSTQTGMSKKQMVESQVGCLRNSFAFPAEGCGISGVS